MNKQICQGTKTKKQNKQKHKKKKHGKISFYF
jgi:hypothetical protein